MTPDSFRAALDSLRWSQRGLAEALKCDDRLVRRWATGTAPVPPLVAAWLVKLATAHDRAPPPTDWRVRQRPDPLENTP